MYNKVLKTIRSRKDKQTTIIKTADAKILADEEIIMSRWKEYFQDSIEDTAHIHEPKCRTEPFENLHDGKEEMTMTIFE